MSLLLPIAKTFAVSAIAGPFIGATVLTVPLAVMGVMETGSPTPFNLIGMGLMMAYPAGIASALAFALLFCLFAVWLKWTNFWAALTCGLIPAIIFGLVVFRNALWQTASDAIMPALLIAYIHLGAAAICWLLIRKSWKPA